jgi:hypothetical protein
MPGYEERLRVNEEANQRAIEEYKQVKAQGLDPPLPKRIRTRRDKVNKSTDPEWRRRNTAKSKERRDAIKANKREQKLTLQRARATNKALREKTEELKRVEAAARASVIRMQTARALLPPFVPTLPPFVPPFVPTLPPFVPTLPPFVPTLPPFVPSALLTFPGGGNVWIPSTAIDAVIPPLIPSDTAEFLSDAALAARPSSAPVSDGDPVSPSPSAIEADADDGGWPMLFDGGIAPALFGPEMLFGEGAASATADEWPAADCEWSQKSAAAGPA